MIRHVPYTRQVDAPTLWNNKRKRRVTQVVIVKLKEEAAIAAMLTGEPVVITSIRDPRIESYKEWRHSRVTTKTPYFWDAEVALTCRSADRRYERDLIKEKQT